MLVRLYVVVDQESEELVDEVKRTISDKGFKISFSPCREQPTLAGCFEFYGTAEMNDEEIDKLLAYLNNDWDGDRDNCSSYGFNTKMFHPNVYYIQFQIQ
ncbi:MAG: hypothetical protein HUJ53_06275 [Holdemanella sp.]|nr:hypothetical protein [Holdemanella sp.]